MSPDLIESDFDFWRYYLQFRTKMVLPGLGITQFAGQVGSSDGDLSPQRIFIVDSLNPNFNTAHETNFPGGRAATIHVEHDFGQFMFRKTGIGFLEWIFFGLTVDCGAMWTEFHREPTYHDNSLSIASTPYVEIGFGLDNLTPFLKPSNLAFEFRWQLSGYNTITYTVIPNLRLYPDRSRVSSISGDSRSILSKTLAVPAAGENEIASRVAFYPASGKESIFCREPVLNNWL